MMILGLLCFAIGLALSGLFSGTEIGIYRIARLRLEVAAVAGDWIAQGLLWLLARPALFVATVLVGNNLANYLVSFAIVLMAQAFVSTHNGWVEILATIAFAPVVFVLGELLPKRLFLQSPFGLLRYTGPVFFVFTILLAPISVFLWLWNRLLALMIASSPEAARSEIAGAEWQHILAEGEHAGLIADIQIHLARVTLQEGVRPIVDCCRPLDSLPRIPLDIPQEKNAEILYGGKRFVLVTHSHEADRLVGYVDVARWILIPERPLREVMRPLLRVLATERMITVLRLMHQHGEKLAAIVDPKDRAQGIVWEDDLRQFCLAKDTTPSETAQSEAVL